MHVRLLVVISLMTGCGAVGKGAAGEDSAAEGGTVADDGTGPDDGIVCDPQIEPRNDSEILLCTDLGDSIVATVAMPEGEPPPDGWPGVVVLHGSGGTFLSGEDEDDPCLEMLEYQFSDWAERLTERGYAVVMPDSYYSRGFCEWNDDTRPDYLDKHEMMILRYFDAVAAANYLCDDPHVDCSRLAVLGFSAGATVTLLLLLEDRDDIHDQRLHDLDDIPSFVGGVAYYPGCGLEGEIIDEFDMSALERFYYPSAPLWVPHAEKDHLHDDCEEVTDPQVDAVAKQHDVSKDMFKLKVYAGAHHGFDGASQNGKQADFDASMDAQARTLKKFEEWF